MAEIEGLVRALREGNDAAKTAAARALGDLAWNNGATESANRVRIAEAGGITPLVQLLRGGSAHAKEQAAWALGRVAYANDANRVRIAEAGGIPPLVQRLRGFPFGYRSGTEAAQALGNLASNNDANAVAIAVAVGFDALVQLARSGRVTVGRRTVVRNAGVPAKRKAALVVAALLRDCVPEFKSAPGDIKDAIGSFV
jgi:vacuolar protein 8